MSREKQQDWEISIYSGKEFSQITLLRNRKVGKDLRCMYFDVLESVYIGEKIFCTQFIDEEQGFRPVKHNAKYLSELFNIQLKVTKNFTDFDSPIQDEKKYCAHVIGNMSCGWLKHIVGFGGTNFCNVFWRDVKNENPGFNNFSIWNESIEQWLFRGTDTKLVEFLNEQMFIFITIDLPLSILYINHFDTNGLLQIIEKVSKVYGYSLNIIRE